MVGLEGSAIEALQKRRQRCRAEKARASDLGRKWGKTEDTQQV